MENIEPYLEKAKQGLKEGNYRNFMENISIAKYLTKFHSKNKQEVFYLYIKGLYKLNDYKAAIQVLSEAFPMFEGETKYDLLNLKGLILGRLGDYKDSIQIFEELAKLDEYLSIKIKAINNLAWAYLYLFKVESDPSFLILAAKRCNEAIKKFDLFDDNILKKKILVNLGTAYWFQKKFDQALETFFEAQKFMQDDPKLFNNIASTFARLGNQEKAMEYLKKAELLADKMNNLFEKAQSYRILAELAEFNQDYMQAVDYYLVAYDLYTSIQAFRESLECQDEIDRLTYLIKQESREIMKESWRKKKTNGFDKEIHFTYKKGESR
ncbi:hypothetical protein BBF96_03585 [Anoxybacter fermentans]|uniref:MalT-like TPR region domain-containing protein n=1 Tax=Anoxybacter fermentans TaxID=1323375 RepID=A0A3Q9HPK8_9FIRM|nr:tetratricopeptide repeat protein [Anoxybacter fermentans]AZR72545.1 hypothetical protein BBF96_03585 [Anoxybacter fermentans]